MLCSAKVQANAESSVGLLTLAGRSARILVTSTRDLGRIFTCMHDVQHDGLADVVAGIQKAQLALKHRSNSLQRQRIVVFVSSPITASTEALVRLGKLLKKNSVAVDVINIGLEGENTAKIDAFIEAVNSSDNSHAIHVEAGGSNLADAVMNSDIYLERDGGGSAMDHSAVPSSAGAGDFGSMDAEAVDPELAMVLRISMEEERQRQAAARQAEQSTSIEGATAGGNKPDENGAPSSNTEGKYEDDDDDIYGTSEHMDVDGDDDAEMLRRAIELSNAEDEQARTGSSGDKKDEDDKTS